MPEQQRTRSRRRATGPAKPTEEQLAAAAAERKRRATSEHEADVRRAELLAETLPRLPTSALIARDADGALAEVMRSRAEAAMKRPVQ